MARSSHTHKYILRKLGKKGTYLVYACALPSCTHYIQADLAIGKLTICWRCGEVTVLTPTKSSVGFAVKPHCPGCTKTYRSGSKKGQEKTKQISIDQLQNLSMEDLLDDIDIIVGGDE